jgi:hypothetical protein
MTPPENQDFGYVIRMPEFKGAREVIGLTHSSNINGMIKHCRDWEDSLPDKAICLEAIGDGSTIFLSMLPGSVGEIYFIERDHVLDCTDFDDYECEEDACEAFDPAAGVVPNIFSKLASSFTAFVANIELAKEGMRG